MYKEIHKLKTGEIMTQELRSKLQAPFNSEDIEWRVQQQGITNEKPWVLILPYVQARAIQNRLDEIFCIEGWTEEYRSVGSNIICRLSVKINNEWISKENGASETQVQAFKGGISSAFKRVAASGFGIGRYLYDLEPTFAETTTEKPSNLKGWNKSYLTEQKLTFWWKTPDLQSTKPVQDLPGANLEELLEDPGEYMLTIGKDRGKKIKDASKENLEWLAKNYSGQKPDKLMAQAFLKSIVA